MSVPRLNVVSTRVDAASLTGAPRSPSASRTLLQFADPVAPLALLRRDRALVGAGEALRIEFSGTDRIQQAARFWRELSAAATIRDEVDVRGSGLTAFSLFTFDPGGAGANGFIVPSTVYGIRGDVAWVTRIAVAGEDFAPLPAPKPLAPRPVATLAAGDIDDERYAQIVQTALDDIARRDYEKIVLARDLCGHVAPGSDLRGIVARLAAEHSDVMTYAADGIVGASPETLVRSEDGQVSARVLAGSAPRGNGIDDVEAKARLLGSAKDDAEHRFAARSAIDVFSRHADMRSSAAPFILELPHLFHIATDLEGRLRDEASALDLVGLLHPTSAVGGTPTNVAMQRILELEGVDRGNYAGPVGWIDHEGNGEWVIALRGARVRADGSVRAFAGAGIVDGSVPALEVAETWAKFGPVRDVFGAGSGR